jgi:hypothetical protein
MQTEGLSSYKAAQCGCAQHTTPWVSGRGWRHGTDVDVRASESVIADAIAVAVKIDLCTYHVSALHRNDSWSMICLQTEKRK